jgi:shikimate dehydrogenase
MAAAGATRLAVLGSPIAHSQSPALQRAAYRVLGLDWEYDAIDITGETLEEFVRSRDAHWRGLSLTMPLKRDILPLLDSRDPLVDLTGSANTVHLSALADRTHLRGFNTDVYGITQPFQRRGYERRETVLVLGGGATAASAMVAAARLSAKRVFVAVRSPERAEGLRAVAEAQGIDLQVRSLAQVATIDERLDAVISTLPNGVDAGVDPDPDAIRSAVLLDVAYHPWPSPLARRWSGEETISGLEMLVFQALVQVRVFLGANPELMLPDEDAVLAAMLAAVGL